MVGRHKTCHWAVCLLTLMLICPCFSEIHRAKSTKTKPGGGLPKFPRYPPAAFSEYGNEASFKTDPDDIEDTRTSETFAGHSIETWIYSMLSAMLVGLSGIFPLLVIPLDAGSALRSGAPAARLKLLLSFAVGGLLGDVFLHLLPEAWAHLDKVGPGHEGHMTIGLWIITGLFSFLLIEKVFPDDHDDEQEDASETSPKTTDPSLTELNTPTTLPEIQANQSIKQRLRSHTKDATLLGHMTNGHIVQNGKPKNGLIKNGHVSNGHLNNGHLTNGHLTNGHLSNGHLTNGLPGMNHDSTTNGTVLKEQKVTQSQDSTSHIKTSGWLNLVANVIDNFTHGLAVAGAYCISTKTGLITTIAVLLHEIPHEFGDFAILLQSGFDRWKAAKAQLLTATGGLLGALCALGAKSAEDAGDRTAWILPFTSGGFIYIALVTVVPDLLKERDSWKSVQQVILILTGIFMVAGVTILFD